MNIIKISELIKNLQYELDSSGDCDVVLSDDIMTYSNIETQLCTRLDKNKNIKTELIITNGE